MDSIEQKILASAAFTEILERLGSGDSVDVRGPCGSAAALLIAATMRGLDSTGLVICPGIQYAEEFTEDAAVFNPDIACRFPALESVNADMRAEGGDKAPDSAIVRSRLKVLRHLLFGPSGTDHKDGEWFEPRAGTRLVCTSINAVVQPVRNPDELKYHSLNLARGTEKPPREIVEWLVDKGFISMPQITMPGEYSLRGGILDIFPHGADMPVRVEFFGDEIDSLRIFDPQTQRSQDRISECQVLAGPALDGQFEGQAETSRAHLLEYLPKNSYVFLIEPAELWLRGGELAGHDADAGAFFTPQEIKHLLGSHITAAFIHKNEPEGKNEIEMSCEQRDVFGVDISNMVDELERISRDKTTVILCAQDAEKDRLNALLKEEKAGIGDRLIYRNGRLNHGVIFNSPPLAVIPHHRLFGRYRQRRILRHDEKASPVSSTEQLTPGDYVVHVQHGIGRFEGMEVLDQGGRKREHIRIEFADQVKIFVPADRLELVHRYIGVGGRPPRLSKIRGRSWQNARKKAEKAAEDLAAELLRIQAVRQAQEGIEHPQDDKWQKQFEAEFPYEETEDQLAAIKAAKADMQDLRPMDRLVCGDVGYGKTEVAMRAAFKCVLGARQVAIVTPTTVLAQQHVRTFRERTADYPVRVEMLSRFVSHSKTRQTLDALAEGKVDIVIGTHRLLQKDVRFKDLGLLVIDEEQRFGVKHKEKFKKMRTFVDILTLTATPIPRTLHMAMMGLRDISALQTPPLSRQAVETHVERFDPDLVRKAIRRELKREGQVYYVHNRVRSIDAVARKVRRLVPEATVAVGHGQMPEKPLAEAMEAFCDGKVDVLVSTTIIENGLDIPNANTLIIDRAELLGLAEMHQIRGRVGRYIHKAYAYFLTPENRPVTPEARKRLDIVRHYSDLGAGFDIALRDLELRGAGNIIGPEQSGHIAAVGYNLYCRMLERARKELEGEAAPPPPATNIDIGMEAFLDEEYVPALQQRIEIYLKLAQAANVEDIHEAEQELRDRFGPIPEKTDNLLLETELRVRAHEAGVDSISRRDGRFHFVLRTPGKFKSRFGGSNSSLRIIPGDRAVLPVPIEAGDAVSMGKHLKKFFSSS